LQNTNIDWEDITKDKDGNLYVGDFGNNDNERKDLCIYKIDKKSLTTKVPFQPTKFPLHILSKKFSS
jgi:sugar lactone lactonase YvrE